MQLKHLCMQAEYSLQMAPLLLQTVALIYVQLQLYKKIELNIFILYDFKSTLLLIYTIVYTVIITTLQNNLYKGNDPRKATLI